MLTPIPIPFPGLLIKLTNYLFSSIFRRYYTQQKLSDLLEINVSSEPASFTVTCSELPRASVWIEINNLSPFLVAVQELEAEFYLSGRVAKFVRILNIDIKAQASERLFIETDLTGMQVEYIRKHKRCQTAALKVNCLASCRLSSFVITDREVSLKNIQFVDCGDSWGRFIKLYHKNAKSARELR